MGQPSAECNGAYVPFQHSSATQPSLDLPRNEALVPPFAGREKVLAVRRPRDRRDGSLMCAPLMRDGAVLYGPNDDSRVLRGCRCPLAVVRDSDARYRLFVAPSLCDVCMGRVWLRVRYNSAGQDNGYICAYMAAARTSKVPSHSILGKHFEWRWTKRQFSPSSRWG